MEHINESSEWGLERLEVGQVVTQNKFRNKINEMSSIRFAMSTKQSPESFCSVDTLTESSVKNILNIHKKGRIKHYLVQNNNTVKQDKKDIYWSLYPDMCEHKPGILSLCLGMPVLIKMNIETELC